MMKDSGSELMMAALKLVVMNVIRMIPHYLGAFLINESVHVYLYGKKTFYSQYDFYHVSDRSDL